MSYLADLLATNARLCAACQLERQRLRAAYGGTAMTRPLWSNDKIWAALAPVSATPDLVAKVMRQMRDEYERKLAELSRYQPIEGTEVADIICWHFVQEAGDDAGRCQLVQIASNGITFDPGDNGIDISGTGYEIVKVSE